MKRRVPGFSAPYFEPDATLVAPETQALTARSSTSQVERSLPVREVLGFPAHLLTGLPLATSLLCSTHEGGRLVLATHQQAPSPPAEYEQAPAFVGPELAALVTAAEQERAGRHELAQWCARKVDKPGWRLTRVEALGGLVSPEPAPGWTTERVFGWLGVELVGVLA